MAVYTCIMHGNCSTGISALLCVCGSFRRKCSDEVYNKLFGRQGSIEQILGWMICWKQGNLRNVKVNEMFVPDSGQQTILYYNPENPHMIYVPAENQTSISTILKIIGIAFVICGCLVGIIGFVVSKNM